MANAMPPTSAGIATATGKDLDLVGVAVGD